MFSLSTTKDLLNLCLSLGTLLVALGLAGLLFYLILTVRKFYQAVKAVKNQADELIETVGNLKAKVEHLLDFFMAKAALKKILKTFSSKKR